MLVLNVIDNCLACECGVCRVLIMTYHFFTNCYAIKFYLGRIECRNREADFHMMLLDITSSFIAAAEPCPLYFSVASM